MIPSTAHFIWLGADLPFIHGLAVRSAARWGRVDRTILHHADPVADTPGGRLAADTAGVELRPLVPEALLEAVGPQGPALVDLYRGLGKPEARVNVLRAALLLQQGGVYLDTDTVTVAPLAPLLRDGAFCGAEPLAYPASTARSRHPLVRGAALARSTVRGLLRALPEGHRWFEHVAGLYPTAVNNAVLGLAPGHALARDLIAGMLATEAERRGVRYALGTHLLQEVVGDPPRPDVVVHPPEVFYPLGPEISAHWFRLRDRVRLADVIRPGTRVAHWYASVDTRAIVRAVDAAYLRAHADRQLFSALTAPLVD